MERAVERLLSALDALDATTDDRKPDDDEAFLGALELMRGGDQRNWTAGANDDREDEHDGAEPCDESEPSLGSFDRLMHQVHTWTERDVPGAYVSVDRA